MVLETPNRKIKPYWYEAAWQNKFLTVLFSIYYSVQLCESITGYLRFWNKIIDFFFFLDPFRWFPSSVQQKEKQNKSFKIQQKQPDVVRKQEILSQLHTTALHCSTDYEQYTRCIVQFSKCIERDSCLVYNKIPHCYWECAVYTLSAKPQLSVS